MSEDKEYNLEVSFETDAKGGVKVSCPLCNSEFKIHVDYLNNDKVVTCPNCKEELTQINLTKENQELLAKIAGETLVNELLDVFPQGNESMKISKVTIKDPENPSECRYLQPELNRHYTS